MIRLSIIAANHSLGHALAPRLRGASVSTEAGATFDAVVFLDAPAESAASIEGLLRTGKHVLHAGALRLSEQELTSLRAVAQQAGAKFAVVNPDRYLPSQRLIRQQLDAGNLGAPGMIRLHRWEPALRHDFPPSLQRDLDLILWYFGKMPNLIYATAQWGLQLHLSFPDGGMALCDHMPCLPAGDEYFSLTLIGSAGSAYSDDHDNLQLLYRGGAPQAIGAGEGIIRWATLVQAFIDSIATGRGDLEDAAWTSVFRLGAAVEKSLRSNQAVAVERVQ